MQCSLISGYFHNFTEERTTMLKVFPDDNLGSTAHDRKKEQEKGIHMTPTAIISSILMLALLKCGNVFVLRADTSRVGIDVTLIQDGRLHDNEQDEREVMYSPRMEEAPSGAPIGKKCRKKRLTTVETRLDVLEVSLEELYQGQQRLLRVESSQEEAESRIKKVESQVDRLTEDTKDSIRHLHEVVAELTAKVMC
ncbi:hypothetical protein GW17_00059430 [Ensete ventricosum]|nr:hypothetical protein GW17_00059430 [Ensete ventricosum]RZR90419.1 hypothetical protein BHM03_00018300 [Ensete ventricosum]